MKRSGWFILLVRQGFEVVVKEQLSTKTKELHIEEVLISNELPGYVFIRSIEIPHNLIYEFTNLDGVFKFLGVKKNQPQKFCNSEINKLRIPQKKQKCVFQIGDHVIIKQGDLADIQGDIIELGKRVVKIKSTMFKKIVRSKIQDIDFL